MNTKTYKIRGMHCASCASIIEKTFKKTEGVSSAEANYGTEAVKISYDESKTSPEALSKKIEKYGYSLMIPITESEPSSTFVADDFPPRAINHSAPLRLVPGSVGFSVEDGSADEMHMSADEHAEHLGLSQSKKEKLAEVAGMRTKVMTAIPLAVISIIFMIWDISSQYSVLPEMSSAVKGFFFYLLPIMATYALFVVGKPYLLGFYRFLRYGKANMDTLIGIGTTAAYLYSVAVTAFADSLRPYINVDSTYFDVTIVVITFITLGKYLEARSKIKTGDAIEKLLNLQAKTALVIRDGKEIEISVNVVVHGDLIIVKPGAKIPVDGTITDGSSFIDEAMVTGEPMPTKKKVGDSVVAGTMNTTGSFTFMATKIGSETLLAQIIKMVEDAQGSKAPIQALADKISSVFVPIVLVIAFVTLGVWLLIGSGVLGSLFGTSLFGNSLGFSQALSFGLVSFVGVLVIACPCALGLATPTAIIVGVGKGAKEGILIKDAATLEKLHKVDTVVVDKTGTITIGRPTLVDIVLAPQGEGPTFAKTEGPTFAFLSILASLEKKSEHPIAHAIVNYANEKGISIGEVSNFEGIQGKGLKGSVGGVEYFVGNVKLINDLGITFDSSKLEQFTAQGKTPVILATKSEVLGFVMVADEIKAESKQAVLDLHKLGIKVVMLTGDDERAAKYMASLVGIDEVIAHVMPQDKLEKIKLLQSQGRVVAMAGDGVNDAPALAQADVGIAMGTGTDVAIESAGITLLGGDISKLVKAIRLSKMTMRGIKQNLFWAFAYNVIGIPLATGLFYPIFGWLLNPVFAGMAMALSSVSVVSNSLRIKAKKL